mmetsp:Transcript_43572/g.100789  ORF Transcript_43572/g.100789 Transcript_43572/m.100789 type:complete len:238 (-) Transcript_43572:640-1353(-)
MLLLPRPQNVQGMGLQRVLSEQLVVLRCQGLQLSPEFLILLLLLIQGLAKVIKLSHQRCASATKVPESLLNCTQLLLQVIRPLTFQSEALPQRPNLALRQHALCMHFVDLVQRIKEAGPSLGKASIFQSRACQARLQRNTAVAFARALLLVVHTCSLGAEEDPRSAQLLQLIGTSPLTHTHVMQTMCNCQHAYGLVLLLQPQLRCLYCVLILRSQGKTLHRSRAHRPCRCIVAPPPP